RDRVPSILSGRSAARGGGDIIEGAQRFRGQRPLKVKDIPFPGLREQLQKTGEEIPNVGEDYTLQQPEDIRGRVAFGALPWLMHDQPFVQGITACAEIGEAMARAVVKPASRARRRLSFD
ncbi:hypothetical protein VXE41_17150, partial [Acinetobacter variabilis]